MNNKRIGQERSAESSGMAIVNCSITFAEEFAEVEILSPSKIYFCERCQLNFHCYKKLESHRLKRNCESNELLFRDSSPKQV